MLHQLPSNKDRGLNTNRDEAVIEGAEVLVLGKVVDEFAIFSR
jgi:hypothetical protein